MQNRSCAVLLASAVTWLWCDVAFGEPIWVGLRSYASPKVSVDAGGEGGRYEPPGAPFALGLGAEVGIDAMPTLIPSVGFEYEWMLDSDHDSTDQLVNSRTLYVPARLRFLGLGTETARFFLNVAVGYAHSWDFNQAPALHSGDSLESSGGFLDLGASAQVVLLPQLRLELGATVRSASVVAQNGVSSLDESTQARFLVPMLHLTVQYVVAGEHW